MALSQVHFKKVKQNLLKCHVNFVYGMLFSIHESEKWRERTIILNRAMLCRSVVHDYPTIEIQFLIIFQMPFEAIFIMRPSLLVNGYILNTTLYIRVRFFFSWRELKTVRCADAFSDVVYREARNGN